MPTTHILNLGNLETELDEKTKRNTSLMYAVVLTMIVSMFGNLNNDDNTSSSKSFLVQTIMTGGDNV